VRCVVVSFVDNPPPRVGVCRHVPYLNFISESSNPSLEPDHTVAYRDVALYSLPVQVRKKNLILWFSVVGGSEKWIAGTNAIWLADC
jgi:hypothetical protein